LISRVLDEVGNGSLGEVGGGGALGLEMHGGGLRVEEVGGGVGALESASDGVGESDIAANVSVDDGEVVARDRASSDLVGVSGILIDGQTAGESGVGNPVAAGSLVEGEVGADGRAGHQIQRIVVERVLQESWGGSEIGVGQRVLCAGRRQVER